MRHNYTGPSQFTERYRTQRREFWDDVASLLKCGLTDAELSGHFGIRTAYLKELCRREKGMEWSEYAEGRRAAGTARLKVAAHKLALEANDSRILMFLLKTRAGMTEDFKVTHTYDPKVKPVLEELLVAIKQNGVDPCAIEDKRGSECGAIQHNDGTGLISSGGGRTEEALPVKPVLDSNRTIGI